MSLDEMIRFLKAINHRFNVSYLDAWNFHQYILFWEFNRRPED